MSSENIGRVLWTYEILYNNKIDPLLRYTAQTCDSNNIEKSNSSSSNIDNHTKANDDNKTDLEISNNNDNEHDHDNKLKNNKRIIKTDEVEEMKTNKKKKTKK